VGPLVRLVEREGEGGADIETEEIFIDGLEISENFLNLVYDVVHIILCELLDPFV
jgi:hypothetical protein